MHADPCSPQLPRNPIDDEPAVGEVEVGADGLVDGDGLCLDGLEGHPRFAETGQGGWAQHRRAHAASGEPGNTEDSAQGLVTPRVFITEPAPLPEKTTHLLHPFRRVDPCIKPSHAITYSCATNLILEVDLMGIRHLDNY